LAGAKESGAVWLAVAGLPGMVDRSALRAGLPMPTSAITRWETAKPVTLRYAGATPGDLIKRRISTIAQSTRRRMSELQDKPKTFTLELNERELAVLYVSLELRKMYHQPPNRNDRVALKGLSERVEALVNKR
jgi:hypothetical protein